MKAYSHPRATRPPNQRPSPRLLDSKANSEERAQEPPPNALDRDRACWHLHYLAVPLGLRLAEKAVELMELEAWSRWGRARFQDFAHEKLDRCGRWLLDQAALGKALRDEPLLRGAMYGTTAPPLLFTSALLIARAPKHVPMQRWIEIARASTVRELKETIRNARSGRPPIDEGNGDTSGRHEAANDDALQQEAYDDPDTLAIHGVQVRMRMPRAIRACVHETLDLHRAVTGADATFISFVEAVFAEATAGLHPPDAEIRQVNPRKSTDRVEAILARANRRWERLAAHTKEFDTGFLPVPESPPRDSEFLTGDEKAERVVREILQLLRVQDHVEREVGQLLCDMSRHGDWVTLGFRSLGHYARERLGMSERTAAHRASVARRLARFPVLENAYRRGKLHREAAGIVASILGEGASAEEEEAWLDHAQCNSIRRLRDERQLCEYDWKMREETSMPTPTVDAPPGGAPCATRGKSKRLARPRPPTDAEWLASLHRVPGRTRDRLEHAMPEWNPLVHPVDFYRANVFLTFRAPRDLAQGFLSAVEAARRYLEWVATETSPMLDGEPASLRTARAYASRSLPVPSWAGLWVLLEDYAKTWDDPASFPWRQWHETYERDGWRCMAPGCTSRKRMDCHHIEYRSDQGSDELPNLLTLCRYHHQQGEHGRYASVRGTAPGGLLWRLGPPAYGEWYRNDMQVADPGRSMGLENRPGAPTDEAIGRARAAG